VHDSLLANIRARVEKCRRLAAATTDEKAAKILRDMADEGEADIRQLLERGEGSDPATDK
jgi:hypothetical protein